MPALPHPHLLLSVITLAALAACNHNDDEDALPPPTVTISGVVADGPLSGATVCYDINDNEACDTDEPTSALTDANGAYRFEVPEAMAGKHAVLALVPATALDKDTGVAVGAALKLKTPATNSSGAQAVFVSPLTTAVADVAKDSGKSVADAALQVAEALGLSMSPLANFVTSSDAGAPQAAVAARALTGVLVAATKLSIESGVSAADANRFARTLATSGMPALATALADSGTAPIAERVAQAVAAVKDEFNLSPQTAKVVADATNRPAGVLVAPGPFVSLRRFAYTDANNYSYTLFTGDSSQTNAAGEFKAHEVRKTLANSADLPYNRNQLYWTGSAWSACALQWEVSSLKLNTTTGALPALYCGGSRSETQNNYEDISGKTLREVVAGMRAYPLADSVSSSTNHEGLPVNWGPDPALLPAAATFPAGSVLNRRRQQADLGGVDRLELSTKQNVLWPDGRYRQATTLEQYSGMPGNLIDAAAVISTSNTVFINDLPLASQADTTLEAFKRWRAGYKVADLSARFYQCDVRKADQASINCSAAGDATLAISTQGGARLLRFASGYPSALSTALKSQRFFGEHSGTVFRGVRDLPSTRHDQRLNSVAWDALRGALGIPGHTPPAAPAGAGVVNSLRNLSYTDANNYSWRAFSGNTALLDSAGYQSFDELREIKTNGQLVPFARNQLLWTGTEWYDCPSNGVQVNRVNSVAPFDSTYCKAYLDERASSVTLTLAGRRMSDVVNDIRAYGSKDGTFDYVGWGPSTSAHPALASALFPAGSTMEYRGTQRTATPLIIGTASADKVRVAPALNTTAAFDTWPYAATLEEFIAKYPGDFKGGSLNGSVAFWVHGITLATAPSTLYNRTFEWRVAFDADGQKARFYSNNRLATNNGTSNYVKLIDTPYSIETLGGLRVLRFATMPDGFERDYLFQRRFGERNGGVWYSWKDTVSNTPTYSIRLNAAAALALGQTLGIR